MAYWVSVKYERNKYVINLDRVSAFVCAPNGRITFWLPDGGTAVIVNRHKEVDDYEKILNYVENVIDRSLAGTWVTICYERCEYVVDLDRISSFCLSQTGKLTFWLPDSKMPIILTSQANSDVYHKILNFVEKKTGYLLS